LYVFGQVKRGVSPETNAVAAMIFAFTIGILLIGQLILVRNARRTGTQGSGSSMAGIITEQSS
jgi:ABC-type spermidine/putrescine transport system permease subunit II